MLLEVTMSQGITQSPDEGNLIVFPHMITESKTQFQAKETQIGSCTMPKSRLHLKWFKFSNNRNEIKKNKKIYPQQDSIYFSPYQWKYHINQTVFYSCFNGSTRSSSCSFLPQLYRHPFASITIKKLHR